MNAVSHRKLRRAAKLLADACFALAQAANAEQHDGDRHQIERLRDQARKTTERAHELHQRHE